MDAPRFEPQDPDFAVRVRSSYGRQPAMATIGATLEQVEPGRVTIELDWAQPLTQQHGFLHAGIVATGLDTACGYAAFSLMAADAAVLTVEYKINLLAPARGQRFRMQGSVIKPGRTLSVVEGRAYALGEGGDKLIATMTATVMAIHGRDDVRH